MLEPNKNCQILINKNKKKTNGCHTPITGKEAMNLK